MEQYRVISIDKRSGNQIRSVLTYPHEVAQEKAKSIGRWLKAAYFIVERAYGSTPQEHWFPEIEAKSNASLEAHLNSIALVARERQKRRESKMKRSTKRRNKNASI